MTDYRHVNRANWDERAPAHAASAGYAPRAVRADPEHLSDVVRFDLPLARRRRRARGRAPAVPHRHRHDLPRPARRPDDRTRLLARLARRGAPARRARRTPTSSFVEADVYAAVDVLGAGALRPGVHRDRRALLAARRPPLGPRRRRAAAPGRPAVHARGPSRAVVARRARTDVLAIEFPYFETPEPLVWDERRHVRRDRRRVHPDRDARVEPRPRRDRHRAARRRPGRSPASSSTTASRGRRSPARWSEVGGGEWRLKDRPERLPHTYTLQAVKRD